MGILAGSPADHKALLNLNIITSDIRPEGSPRLDIGTKAGQDEVDTALSEIDRQDKVHLIVIDSLATLTGVSAWLPIRDWLLRMRQDGRNVPDHL